MSDEEIRLKLKDYLQVKFKKQEDSQIVDEFTICKGETRVDVAVINDKLWGYEIKSDKDTLSRLPKQINLYNKTMERITLVCGQKYFQKCNEIIPKWWGLYVYICQDKKIFHRVREPKQNPKIDKLSLVELLWKDELLEILNQRGFVKGFKSKPKHYLWNFLAENFELDELLIIIKERLKAR